MYLFVFKLGASTLWNFDEAAYGEAAKEMLKLGNWITPHFNYRPWFDKPPLYIWLTALSFRFFGWNEFTTRLWSALFGIGGVIVVYFLGKSIFNKRVGFVAGLVLATSFQYIVQSRLAVLDVTLNFFISLSFLFFYLGYRTPRKRVYYLLFFTSMGLATLAKGPIGALFPCLIIGFYLLLAKETKILKEMRIFWGIIVYLVVAVPWYALEFWRHGNEFIGTFFLLRHFTRYLTPLEGQGGPIYYYIPFLFLGFFPWSSFLPYSVVHLIRSRTKGQSKERKKFLLILLWFAVIFIFFTFAQTKLPNYILPLYPALALIVGKFWNDSFTKAGQGFHKGTILSLLFFLLMAVVFSFTVVMVLKSKFALEYSQYGKSLFPIAVILLSGSIASLLMFLWKRKTIISFALIVGMMCFSIFSLVNYVLPGTNQYKPTKFLSHQIISVIQPGEKIGNYPAFDENPLSFNPSLIYYSNHPVKGIDSEESLLHFLESKERVYCFMEKKDYLEVKEKLKRISFYVLAERNEEIVISNKKNK